jgi:hypothetical protein
VKYALLAGLAALLFGGLVLAFQPSSKPGSSPDRTAYSFAAALKRHNFGRACSYYSQKTRGDAAACAQSVAIYVGQIASFFGADIVEDMHIVPGSKTANKDGSYTYKMVAKGGQPQPLRVAKQASGKWRVVG